MRAQIRAGKLLQRAVHANGRQHYGPAGIDNQHQRAGEGADLPLGQDERGAKDNQRDAGRNCQGEIKVGHVTTAARATFHRGNESFAKIIVPKAVGSPHAFVELTGVLGNSSWSAQGDTRAALALPYPKRCLLRFESKSRKAIGRAIIGLASFDPTLAYQVLDGLSAVR
jgi:hypothetical protein